MTPGPGQGKIALAASHEHTGGQTPVSQLQGTVTVTMLFADLVDAEPDRAPPVVEAAAERWNTPVTPPEVPRCGVV